MIKSKIWALIFALLLLFSALALILIPKLPSGGTTANIYRDGVPIRSIDLSLVTEPYEFTLSDERGENVVRVEPGRIAVISADCPDGICVASGWRSGSASPIVCLPHRLVIRVEKSAAADGEPDAVSR